MASGKATLAAEKHSFAFDDRNLRWSKLRDLEHFVFLVFDVDLERGLVDFILKFEPNQRIILHRHLALTNTLVVQGEHRLYEPTGALKEIRPVGSYTSSPPGEPHKLKHLVDQRRLGTQYSRDNFQVTDGDELWPLR